MKLIYFIISICGIALIQENCLGQADYGTKIYKPAERNVSDYRIMFYNAENLFDIYDDPTKTDESFTPEGEKQWTYYRYHEKLNKLAKTIIAIGEWSPPEIIALCEIENFQVLVDLISKTPLSSYNYAIVHHDSEDRRGIDVALLYRTERIQKIKSNFIRIHNDTVQYTREILHSTLLLNEQDSLEVFVNHWPSRYGGQDISEPKRIAVARSLRHYIDSVARKDLTDHILIMGDFNDDPSNVSLREYLNAIPYEDQIDTQQLYNLSWQDFKRGEGTLTYKEITHTKYLFDQMIVSGSLLKDDGLSVRGALSHIFVSDWLIQDGRPYRTYQGPMYKGGVSDHLPVFLDLKSLEKLAH